MDVECGQLGEVPVKPQGHQEAGVLIGQLGTLGLVVGDPCGVDAGGRGDLQARRHAVMEAGPAGHVGRDVDVAAIKVHRRVSGRGPA